MNTNKNAAIEAVLAAACLDELPLDLHALHKKQSRCGYDNPVNLKQFEASSIAASLRGLAAVTAVLHAGVEREHLKLSDWLQGGLLDAMHELTANAQYVLEAANSRADEDMAKKGGAACAIV